MQGFFWLEGFVLPKKQLIVGSYFPILAFIILVQLTILSKHLFLIKHVGNKHSKDIHIITIIFHLSLYVAEVLSSLINRDRRPIRIEFLTLQGKPNTHTWGAKSPMQHFPFLVVFQVC